MAKNFYVITKHVKGCWMAKPTTTGSVLVSPDVKYVDPRRDKTKPRRNRDSFLVYRCNMPNCPAGLAVRLDHVAESLKVNEGTMRLTGRRLR